MFNDQYKPCVFKLLWPSDWLYHVKQMRPIGGIYFVSVIYFSYDIIWFGVDKVS